MLEPRSSMKRITMLLLMACGSWRTHAAEAATNTPSYAVEQERFGTLEGLKGERSFGQVGVTGLKLRFYDGLKLTVEETAPGTPADGKFQKGERIIGVNGVTLKGNNPFIVCGSALTEAEATDGKLVFEVQEPDGKTARMVDLRIPVLGAYSETWPLDCAKSRAIIKQAAAYYARTTKYVEDGDEDKGDQLMSHGVGGALATLFLLSTGDDQYLPRVKAYVDHLATNVQAIGDNTWDNGYNGIVCAEYYLRTGDKAVLPALQYYCDDAKERQFYGVGWGHWGKSINPGYTAGGLMNPAGSQVATTLLLAKECGVKVDEPTLLGALRQWYRFAGHGSVAYGDHRGEGGCGSNGKDGMAAAMMQAACGSAGDIAIYRQARDYFSQSTLDSYPRLVSGHGDNGRGDGIWLGIASAYMLQAKPHEYHEFMKHLRWWFDLSRRPAGGLGMAMATRFDDEGSGAGLALAYTAPLKTLRITGAPRSKYAKAFKLPEQLWGRQADLAFLSIEHGKPYGTYGKDEPVHVPLRFLGDAYSADTNALAAVPRGEILKNVYHHRYMIRAQAAKALLRLGAFDELEKLLQDPDPRIRRAGLDGMTDYRYWFAMGKNPIKPEQVTPAMVASIRKMLADPDEALYVVDGALMALSRAPSGAIMESLPLVMPWTTHDEWWVRQSAFSALAGAGRETGLLPKVLPTMLDMMIKESRGMPRQGMQSQMALLWQAHKTEPLVAPLIAAAFQRVVKEEDIKSGPRSGEGAYNVIEAVSTSLNQDPLAAMTVAGIVRERFPQLETKSIAEVAGKLLALRDKLPDDQREALTGVLYGDYRGELIRRMEAKASGIPLNTILALTQLKSPDIGWQVVDRTTSADRIWRFVSFDPPPAEALHPRIGKRFRDVTLPAGLAQWSQPGFDDSGWTSGKAPVGTGVYEAKRGKKATFTNPSDWGAGEFLIMRTTINMAALDYDYYRLRVLANQGYHVYLNGQKICTYEWWQGEPIYREIVLGPDAVKHLKTGANVLAVYANAAYKDGAYVAQVDVYLEGVKKTDLIGRE